MSIDHTGMTGNSARDTGSTDSVTDAPLMAATPIWETRGKKRRGRGGASNPSASGLAAATTTSAGASTVAAEPRSFDSPMDTPRERAISETRPMTEPSMASAAMATDPMTGRPDMTEHSAVDTTDAGLVAPIGRTRAHATPARRSGAPVAAIAAGAVALAAVGAAGWYATRTDDGVAELTPGATQESLTIAEAPPAASAAPLATAPEAATQASTPAPTTAAAATTERRAAVRTASVSRVRPAATSAPSATEAGIDASGTATLPTGPQPYSTLSPGAATDTATTGVTGSSGVPTAPSATPAPIPSVPPIVSDPAPTIASPATPEPSTPPTTTTPQ